MRPLQFEKWKMSAHAAQVRDLALRRRHVDALIGDVLRELAHEPHAGERVEIAVAEDDVLAAGVVNADPIPQ